MRAPRLRPGDKWEIPLGPWDAGINKKDAPYKLESNELKDAANMIFDEVPGTGSKRWGSQVIAALPSALPPKYGYVFKMADGTEHFLICDGANLYDTTDLTTFTELITGLDDTAYLQFDTADDRCWITNGSEYVMWYDGTNLVVMDREYGNPDTSVAATGDAGTDTEHIVDADLTSAVVGYWKFRKVVITSGPAAGAEAEVTAFDPVTDKLTISPAIAGLTTGAGYMVGVILPRGKIIRFCDGTLFLGDTPENRSETRFNKPADLDTGLTQSIDNPRAWPADHQLAITQDDGDHLYSYSPVFRNRVIVSKGGSLYRLEPDATYVWRPYLISQAVGCKHPDSWAVKNEMLYFLGCERSSGLLDYFATDLVSVRPIHKDGRFIPAFDSIQKGSASYQFITRATETQFNTGARSTLCETGNGKLECRVIDTDADWDEVISTKTNLNVGDSLAGAVNIIGIPPWTAQYEGNKLPAVDTPAWTKYSITPGSETIVGSAVKIFLNYAGAIQYYKDAVYDSSKNTFVAFRVGATALVLSFGPICTVQNGTKKIETIFEGGRILVNGVDAGACDIVTAWKCVSILLDKDGNGSVYVAGARVWTGAAAAATGYSTYWTTNSIMFGARQISNYGPAYAYFDYVYEDNDFFFTAATLPATLPASGTAEIKIDYTRAPAAFGKYFLQREVDVEGETEAGTSAAQIVDATRTEDDDFWNGRTVVIISGVNAGQEGRCTNFDKITNTITIGFTADPGVGVKYQILKDDGTVLIQTASSAGDVTYSGWDTLVNSTEPGVDNTTPLARYLKIKITLTRASWEGFTNYAKGPVIQTLTGGFLWRLLGQQVGTQITAWRNWQSDITEAAGSSLLQQARIAKTIAAPVEGDYEPLATIVDGNNIGIVLADAPPPAAGEGRWLDAIVEGSPGPDGTSPSLDNLTANWQEGTGAILAVAAFIYKKRLYLTAISATAAHNDLLYVLDTKNAWTIFTGLTIFRLVAFKGLVYGLSAVDANILQHEVTGLYTDAGVAITGRVDTGEINFGHQRAEMSYVKLGVAAAGSYQVLLSADGETWVSKGTLVFTAAETQKLRIPRGWMGKRHFVRVKSAGAEAAEIVLLAAGFRALAEV